MFPVGGVLFPRSVIYKCRSDISVPYFSTHCLTYCNIPSILIEDTVQFSFPYCMKQDLPLLSQGGTNSAVNPSLTFLSYYLVPCITFHIL